MKIIALTGGIGSGKTTVAKMFKALGVPVYDSDKEAKKLLRRSKKLKKALISLLGEEAYIGKKLNKDYVSGKIFADKSLLQKMNGIVHPAVRKHFSKWASKQETPYVIQEAAVIFENGSQHNYDAIILITAPQDTRIDRVMTRDEISRDQVLARIKNQLGDGEKIALSDFVIHNTNLEETEAQVLQLDLALRENS